jgi:hypothetical protein
MKIAHFLILIFLLISSTLGGAQTSADDKKDSLQLLLIGDSNLVGFFGDHLHREIQNLNKFNVYSIAIGGAGTRYFTQTTMRNLCCGYKIRKSFIGQKNFLLVESTYKKNKTVVAKKYGGNFMTILKELDVDVLLIALGANYGNQDRERFFKKVLSFKKDIPIIWIGPPSQKKINYIENDIKSDTKPFNVKFISCKTKAIGNHQSNKSAKKWTDRVMMELKPELIEIHKKLSNKVVTHK